MIITWSQGEILHHFDVPSDNRLMFEKYTDFIFSVIDKKSLNAFKLRYYRPYVILQPAIKLYSSNHNLLRFDRRLFELAPWLKRNMKFWLFLTAALILPKSFWKLVRIIQHRKKNIFDGLENKKLIEKRFAYLEKIFF